MTGQTIGLLLVMIIYLILMAVSYTHLLRRLPSHAKAPIPFLL